MTLSDPSVVNHRIVEFVFNAVVVFFSFFGWLLAFAALRYFVRVVRGGR